MGEIHQYQHQHHQPPQQSQQPQPVFEQRQQQKSMTEQLANFPFFNHFNLQYNYNNYNYQQQQIFQQFQNIQTNHHGIFPSHQHFPPQQYLEQQQRRLQPENNHNHHYHHYQPPSCTIDDNNNNNNPNNFRGFITGGGGSIIPIPSSIPLDLSGNGRYRNDNDVTASRFTSLARPSHFWRTLNTDILHTDICGDTRNKSGDYINDADENGKHIEYHNHNHQEEMNQNQNQKQNYGFDDHNRQETSKSCGRYFSELEEALCGHTSTASPAAIISLPPPPPLAISDEFIISHLNAKKVGKQVVKEEVEQEMQPSPSTVPDHDDHDHDRKRKKRRRERDEEMEWMEKLFQTLVNQLVESMEACFMKFLEKIEKIDKERREREESWRRRGMENLQLKLSVSSKSHIENRALPTMAPPTTTSTTTGDDPSIAAQTITTKVSILNGKGSSSKRWPEEEVDALIQLRRNLSERFQEPGLKWPLWQEISNRMSSMGFHQRDAKRCKEKWDNIIKYFKKQQQQDGRRQKLKTCVYFDKLDQFYNSNSSSIDNRGCYGGGGGGGNVDLEQSQREEISVQKTDVGLVEGEEEYDEEEWNEFDSRF